MLPIVACFNSMIVRLKVSLIFSPNPYESMFQFYDSPIKRSYSATPSKCELGFNSMIVRLKGYKTATVSAVPFTGFNSMIVRLKDYSACGDAGEPGRFNSMIVRLKVNHTSKMNYASMVSIL